MKVNKDYLFGCQSPSWDRDGIIGFHAYSILKAKEYKNERLLMVKNPWGHSEWRGPWSDGSSQWTAEAIDALEFKFGDDGIFWIRYEDLLSRFNSLWRTRLFNADWMVSQQWIKLTIPWTGEYKEATYNVDISKRATTVLVLSQLDDRYFRGLQGQYVFVLSFTLHCAGQEDYIVSTPRGLMSQRSVNVELDLDAGSYEVRLKISAFRDNEADKYEDVMKANLLTRREKLQSISLSYDRAHAKGQQSEEDEKREAAAETEVASEDEKPNDAGIDMSTKATGGPLQGRGGLPAKDITPQGYGAHVGDETPRPRGAPGVNDGFPRGQRAPDADGRYRGQGPPATYDEFLLRQGSPGPGVDPPWGQASLGEPPRGQASLGKPTRGQTSLGEPPRGQAIPEAGGEYPPGRLGSYARGASQPVKCKPEPPPSDPVCVVGLRAYCKNAEAYIQIAKSNKPAIDETKLEVGHSANNATVLPPTQG